MQDRYYTPVDVAADLAAIVRGEPAIEVLDSNCGEGRLLDAAAAVFPGARFTGIDLDRNALVDLARLRPSWQLVCGDALTPHPWAELQQSSADVAVLNPPFSMVGTRGTQVQYEGESLRVSTAMAHVMTVLDRAKPCRVAAILPESWAFSQLDAPARDIISRQYSIDVIKNIKNSTFQGARANCLLVAFSRRHRPRKLSTASSNVVPLPYGLELVRGGLPLFEAKVVGAGHPYLHSTDIVPLTFHGIQPKRRVQPISRGLVRGHVVLFPRVGLPKREACCPVFLPRWTQLSDCVLAVTSPDRATANGLCNLLHAEWFALLACYSGTGARFTTEARLRNLLASL